MADTAESDQPYQAGDLAGSTMQPVYQKRTMRCFVVTESELHQLGLANLGITAFAALGSFCCAFGFDVLKDLWINPDVPDRVAAVAGFVQPAAWFMGVVFYVLAGVTWSWRNSLLKLIREESDPDRAVD